jgi:hypothetical protein
MLLTPSGFFYGSRLSVFDVVDTTFTINSSSSTAPLGIQAGDLIIFSDLRAANANGNTSRIPTGFTSLIQRNQSFFGSNDNITTRANVSYKIADGSEGGSTLLGQNSGNKLCIVLRGNFPITSVTASGWTGAGGSSNGTSTLDIDGAEGEAPLLIVSAGYDSLGNFSHNATPSPSEEFTPDINSAIKIWYQLSPASLTSISTSVTSTGTSVGRGRHIVGGIMELGID